MLKYIFNFVHFLPEKQQLFKALLSHFFPIDLEGKLSLQIKQNQFYWHLQLY